MVATIKEELKSEMGLIPLQLLRDRRSSFVELYSYDNFGKTNYGTAGYLGGGYFITVKHAVVALPQDDGGSDGRKIVSVKIVYRGKEIAAKVVDTGDADAEVHSGDWAIIKTDELDLPALRADTEYAYDFADPIFRLGNDYSKGIILSTRLRGPADGERAGHLSDRWPPGRVGRRRARSARQSGGHSRGPDAGRLSFLVHPAAAPRDAAESAGAASRITGDRYRRKRNSQVAATASRTTSPVSKA